MKNNFVFFLWNHIFFNTLKKENEVALHTTFARLPTENLITSEHVPSEIKQISWKTFFRIFNSSKVHILKSH